MSFIIDIMGCFIPKVSFYLKRICCIEASGVNPSFYLTHTHTHCLTERGVPWAAVHLDASGRTSARRQQWKGRERAGAGASACRTQRLHVPLYSAEPTGFYWYTHTPHRFWLVTFDLLKNKATTCLAPLLAGCGTVHSPAQSHVK